MSPLAMDGSSPSPDYFAAPALPHHKTTSESIATSTPASPSTSSSSHSHHHFHPYSSSSHSHAPSSPLRTNLRRSGSLLQKDRDRERGETSDKGDTTSPRRIKRATSNQTMLSLPQSNTAPSTSAAERQVEPIEVDVADDADDRLFAATRSPAPVATPAGSGFFGQRKVNIPDGPSKSQQATMANAGGGFNLKMPSRTGDGLGRRSTEGIAGGLPSTLPTSSIVVHPSVSTTRLASTEPSPFEPVDPSPLSRPPITRQPSSKNPSPVPEQAAVSSGIGSVPAFESALANRPNFMLAHPEAPTPAAAANPIKGFFTSPPPTAGSSTGARPPSPTPSAASSSNPSTSTASMGTAKNGAPGGLSLKGFMPPSGAVAYGSPSGPPAAAAGTGPWPSVSGLDNVAARSRVSFSSAALTGAHSGPRAGPMPARPRTAGSAAPPFKALTVDELASLLAESHADTSSSSEPLLLDLRPPTAFASARVPDSINIVVPTTLLKRPGHGLDRVEAALDARAPSGATAADSEQARFARAWRNTSSPGTSAVAGAVEQIRAYSLPGPTIISTPPVISVAADKAAAGKGPIWSEGRRLPQQNLGLDASGLLTPASASSSSSVPSSQPPVVVAFDLDSSVLTDVSPVALLLAKFERSGVPRDRLRWLQGGWSALAKGYAVRNEGARKIFDQESWGTARKRRRRAEMQNERGQAHAHAMALHNHDRQAREDSELSELSAETGFDEGVRRASPPDSFVSSGYSTGLSDGAPSQLSLDHRPIQYGSSAVSEATSIESSRMGSKAPSRTGDDLESMGALGTFFTGQSLSRSPAGTMSLPSAASSRRPSAVSLEQDDNQVQQQSGPVLRCYALPTSAFNATSTREFEDGWGPGRGDRGKRTTEVEKREEDAWGHLANGPPTTKAGMYSDVGAATPSVGYGFGSMGLGAGTGTGAGSRPKMAANPFFDNIRQNAEALSLARSLEHAGQVELPPEVSASLSSDMITSRIPAFLARYAALTPGSRGQRLAREFFEIEFDEQQRLQGVMAWHSRHSGAVDSSAGEVSGQAGMRRRSSALKAAMPNSPTIAEEEGSSGSETDEGTVDRAWQRFGIGAGVERGHLNRYKNIWPYDHARCKLPMSSTRDVDYVNASHVNLRGTSKSFLAAQAPMSATVADFWHLVLQERVNVIVMLTRRQEGGREKCSNYWKSGTYGDIILETVNDPDESAAARHEREVEDTDVFGGFFATSSTQPPGQDPATIIRRTVRVSTTNDEPGTEPIVVSHLQYLAWPDFDVPPAASDVLSLVDEVNGLSADPGSSICVHCSAGVGRTGSYIAIDAILETLARKRRSSMPQLDLMALDSRPVSRAGTNDLLEVSDSDTQSRPSTAATTASMDVDGDDASPRSLAPPASKRGSSPIPADIERLLMDPSNTPPLQQEEPILAVVQEMRKARMSMVANSAQYAFVWNAVLAGVVKDVKSELKREGKFVGEQAR